MWERARLLGSRLHGLESSVGAGVAVSIGRAGHRADALRTLGGVGRVAAGMKSELRRQILRRKSGSSEGHIFSIELLPKQGGRF